MYTYIYLYIYIIYRTPSASEGLDDEPYRTDYFKVQYGLTNLDLARPHLDHFRRCFKSQSQDIWNLKSWCHRHCGTRCLFHVVSTFVVILEVWFWILSVDFGVRFWILDFGFWILYRLPHTRSSWQFLCCYIKLIDTISMPNIYG